MSQPLVSDKKVRDALTRAAKELMMAGEEHRALSKRINVVVQRLNDLELNAVVRLQVDSLADTSDLHKTIGRRVNNVASVIQYLLTGGKDAAQAAPTADNNSALSPEQIKQLLGES